MVAGEGTRALARDAGAAASEDTMSKLVEKCEHQDGVIGKMRYC